MIEGHVRARNEKVAIVQQLVGQLPWDHSLVLLTKLKTDEARRRL
jgi:predicted nuclease of restriction endonuclease-like (RecB) superfamily